MLERARCLDAGDPLEEFRERFDVPEGVIYLDGNSLGCLPKATPERLEQVVREEWGRDLIRSWNSAGWINLSSKIGTKIAPLIGAQAEEVIASDSTSTANCKKPLTEANLASASMATLAFVAVRKK